MTKTISQTSHGFFKFRTWEVQKPPYRTPLPFRFGTGVQTASSGDPNRAPIITGSSEDAGNHQHGINTTYAKIVSTTQDQSQWANNLVEAHESLGMITSKANALISATKAIRKGDVRGVLNSFGFVGTASVRTKTQKILKKYYNVSNGSTLRRSKAFGDAWLELHFGWTPLVQDIGAAADTLSKTDFGTRKLSVSTSQRFYSHTRTGGDGFFTDQQENGRLTTKMGGMFTVSNPNAFLASQLGLVNPLSVAWEAVPYSFVVDWFSNVGQVLSAMTDFVGVNVTNGYTTTFQEGTVNFSTAQSFGGPFDFSASSSGVSHYCQRILNITGPSLEIKPFKGFSATRGATAISLLLQHLR